MSRFQSRGSIVRAAVVAVALLSSRPADAQVTNDPGPPREPGGLVNNLLTGVEYDILNQAKAERRLQHVSGEDHARCRAVQLRRLVHRRPSDRQPQVSHRGQRMVNPGRTCSGDTGCYRTRAGWMPCHRTSIDPAARPLQALYVPQPVQSLWPTRTSLPSQVPYLSRPVSTRRDRWPPHGNGLRKSDPVGRANIAGRSWRVPKSTCRRFAPGGFQEWGKVAQTGSGSWGTITCSGIGFQRDAATIRTVSRLGQELGGDRVGEHFDVGDRPQDRVARRASGVEWGKVADQRQHLGAEEKVGVVDVQGSEGIRGIGIVQIGV